MTRTLLCVLLLSVVGMAQQTIPLELPTLSGFCTAWIGDGKYSGSADPYSVNSDCIASFLDLIVSDRRVRDLMPLVEPELVRDEWVQDGRGRWHHTCKAGYYRDTQDGACHESLVVITNLDWAEGRDVPAIRSEGIIKSYWFHSSKGMVCWTPNGAGYNIGSCPPDGYDTMPKCHGEWSWSLTDSKRLDCIELPRWSCADKARILLTDEAGGKHCIKF